MPHIILEHSTNIIEASNLQTLFSQIQNYLVATLPTKLSYCKSRAYQTDCFVLGDNASESGFVHLTIKVLPGRDAALLEQASNDIMKQLEGFFSESIQRLNIQVSVEVLELAEAYCKRTVL